MALISLTYILPLDLYWITRITKINPKIGWLSYHLFARVNETYLCIFCLNKYYGTNWLNSPLLLQRAYRAQASQMFIPMSIFSTASWMIFYHQELDLICFWVICVAGRPLKSSIEYSNVVSWQAVVWIYFISTEMGNKFAAWTSRKIFREGNPWSMHAFIYMKITVSWTCNSAVSILT